jgi:nicotinate-nucleotide adenylyltransferase
MRIGIFGGTFNPVHQGHLIAAEEIRQRFQLQRIIFVPSARPPHKPNLELMDAKHRLEMARLAIEGNPHFDISSIELDRSGYSYSVETVQSFRKEFGEDAALFFIIGADAFPELNSWHEPERLIGLCNFIVLSRPGFSFDEVFQRVEETFGIKDHEEKDRVSLPNGHFLYLAEITPVGISSTLIRSRIREGGAIKYLLPEPVESYILSNNLYKNLRG